jgi:nucleotide sugar dehydrogenase
MAPTHLVVIGLGYVGLPLAAEACRSGLRVTGIDISQPVVDGLNSGRSHVDDLSDDDIRQMLEVGFMATTDTEPISVADVVVICVPTPLSLDGGPDLSAIESATEMIRQHIHPGLLVVLESTTYPGTTDEIVRPALETGALKVGADFHLAFSPERIDPGNSTYGIRNTPKVVGGITPECTDKAAEFYGTFVDTVVRARGTREAEMAKLLENTYRHINIALVNEMAVFSHELGIDLWNVIECARSKPFGFQAFFPGPGVGGHCIPIDPNYLSHNVRAKLGYPFRFVELAQEVNNRMPAYVGMRVQDLLNRLSKPINNSSVLILGVTYKPNIADQRESPAIPLARFLLSRGARLAYHDPFVSEWTVDGRTFTSAPDVWESARSADLVVLLQDHESYDVEALAEESGCFLDTRGRTKSPKVARL